MSAMFSSRLFVLLLVVTTVIACPFLNRAPSNSRDEPHLRSSSSGRRHLLQGTTASSPTSAPTSSSTRPFCKATGGAAASATQESICTAFTTIRTEFAALIAGKNLVYLSALYGGAVRLAFHDAGEIDITASDLMGPDGCLSPISDNAGLMEPDSVVTSILEPMWQNHCDKISRADFWVLFAKLCLEASDPSRRMLIPFYYGRKDNVVCTAGEGRLPGAEGHIEDVSKVFVTQMGLTMDDAVTLLGAHTLGHVHLAASGYGFNVNTTGLANVNNNAWDNSPATFDNVYYTQTIRARWVAGEPVTPGEVVWHQGPGNNKVRLTAEMALAFPIVSASGAVVIGTDCGPNEPTPTGIYGCSVTTNRVTVTDRTPPPTYATFAKFANGTVGQTAFLAAFPVSFVKMTNAGYNYGLVTGQKLGSLTLYGTCPSPTARPSAKPTARPSRLPTATPSRAPTSTSATTPLAPTAAPTNPPRPPRVGPRISGAMLLFALVGLLPGGLYFTRAATASDSDSDASQDGVSHAANESTVEYAFNDIEHDNVPTSNDSTN